MLRQKMREKCWFCTPTRQKHPKMPPKPEKHAIFNAQTPIFWTQPPVSRKMKELNKALHRTAHKAPPVTADVGTHMKGGQDHIVNRGAHSRVVC